MSRLEILKNSLSKKIEKLNSMYEAHFADVKSANGQPLNDKRNGRATMDRWERQRISIRNMEASIEATKRAIGIEESKIEKVEESKEVLPKFILDMVESGELNQWRKFPNRFFVKDVKHARIIWDYKKKTIFASHVNELKALNDADMWRKFAQCFNKMLAIVNNK